MKLHHIKTVLLVFAVAGWTVAGCDEDRGPLCEQSKMDACNNHQFGACLDVEICTDDDTQCWDAAECMCLASAYYKTSGLTCAPLRNSCQPACQDDADCRIGGADVGSTCGEDKRCTEPETDPACDSNGMCVAQFAGWITDCTDGGGECAAGMLCIDAGDGVGKCAQDAHETPCADPMAQYVMPDIDGSGDVWVVCGIPDAGDAVCGAEDCENPCNKDDDCIPGAASCDVDSGTCVCAGDADCRNNVPHTSVCTDEGWCVCDKDSDCNGADGASVCVRGVCVCGKDSDCAAVPGASVCVDDRCVCGKDSDCTEFDNVDKCHENVCICTSFTVCTAAQPFDGTSWVCEDEE